MREIKFRAWDKRDNKWAFTEFDIIGETWLFGLLEQYCRDTKGDVTTIERINDIDIQQFTGLKDSTGNDIYEGDILKTVKGVIGEVIWEDSRSTISFKYRNRYNTNYNFQYIWKSLFWAASRSIVIGNIFETPKLIK